MLREEWLHYSADDEPQARCRLAADCKVVAAFDASRGRRLSAAEKKVQGGQGRTESESPSDITAIDAHWQPFFQLAAKAD